MDIDDLRGVSTILCMIAFFAVVYWAFGPSSKAYFESAAQLPFIDSPERIKSPEASDESEPTSPAANKERQS